jgi:putative DNA primase/helicase
MSLPNGHGSQEKRPPGDRPNWRKCTGRPDCGCWVCLDKAGISLPEAREPEEGRDQKQAEESLVAQLARLSTFEYDRKRKGAAKAIGITVATLDKAVAKQRGRANAEDASLPHWKVEPWPDVVAGDKLLNDLVAIFTRYVILPKHAAEALALWVVHAWAFDAWDISPFMVIISPEKRCGKTTVLIILQFLTPRSELASNISAAAVFRYVEDERPTLLIDEADTFIKDSEEMRGVLNSGHTKTAAYVIRTVEVSGEHKAKRFSTWAPKAIATIRSLADTLEDRSIIVTMQRKKKSETVERLRRSDNDDFATLRRQALRWCEDNLKILTTADPVLPDTLNDRAADNWRPLLAVADRAGGEWPIRARHAALVLSGDSAEGGSIRTQLLADIRPLLIDETIKGLTSEAIIAELVKKPDRPWADWKHGKAITPKALAALLKPFNIIPDRLYLQANPDSRGYARHALEEAFSCYLPPLQCDDVAETPQPHAQVTAFQCGGGPPCRHIAKPEETVGAVAQPPHRHIEISRTAEKRKSTVNKANPPALGPAGDSLDDFK